MFRSYRSGAICVGLTVLLTALLFIDCKKETKPAALDPADQLIGVWRNIEHHKKPILRINKNGTYFLQFIVGNLQFNGNYHISGDLIHVLDFYCGTSIPGIYRYKVQGNDLTFECIDDNICDRYKFFTQKWKRIK